MPPAFAGSSCRSVRSAVAKLPLATPSVATIRVDSLTNEARRLAGGEAASFAATIRSADRVSLAMTNTSSDEVMASRKLPFFATPLAFFNCVAF